MEPITVKLDDSSEYVVSAISWFKKNKCRTDTTKINYFNQTITPDEEAYMRGMYKLCITKNGSPLTDADLELIDGKTGDALTAAIHMLNDLSPSEKLNLLNRLAPITSSTQ